MILLFSKIEGIESLLEEREETEEKREEGQYDIVTLDERCYANIDSHLNVVSGCAMLRSAVLCFDAVALGTVCELPYYTTH